LNDIERAQPALKGIIGKRLTYRRLIEGPRRYGRKARAEAKTEAEQKDDEA
jgi:hypothetical protein